jgi:hypothetical protein
LPLASAHVGDRGLSIQSLNESAAASPLQFRRNISPSRPSATVLPNGVREHNNKTDRDGLRGTLRDAAHPMPISEAYSA